MLKIKYLHRRKGKKNYNRDWYGKKYKRIKKYYYFLNLPKHESIRQHRFGYHEFAFEPLCEFLESKVGCDWNDVYSELLKKIKSKYKYSLKYYLDSISKNIIYYDDYIPRNLRGRILSNTLFVDLNNILTRKSEEELIVESKKIIRSKKLKELYEKN